MNIKDIDKLPSVLPIEEVNLYMGQLLDVINSDSSINSLDAAVSISDLISFQGYNKEGLSFEISMKILNWIKRNYDSSNLELTDYCLSNLANLTCKEAIDYLKHILASASTEWERKEISQALDEIIKR